MSFRIRYMFPGALALLAAGIVYFLAEAITAFAWKNPAYSYAADYISDLGVPGPRENFLNHIIFSPLATIMNIGFILNSILVIVAGILLLRFFSGCAARIVFLLPIMYGVGFGLVAVFHASLDALKQGVLIFHGLGALLAICAGNIFMILLGAYHKRYNVAQWFGIISILLGSCGLLCLLLELANILPTQPGIFERGAVYPLMIFQLFAGSTLLVFWLRQQKGNTVLIGS